MNVSSMVKFDPENVNRVRTDQVIVVATPFPTRLIRTCGPSVVPLPLLVKGPYAADDR